VNIDFETREIKQQTTSLNIVRFGTSGALQADIPVDSFVASTHGLGFDNLLNYYAYDKTKDENELIDAFVAQTGLNTNITIPYISKGSETLLNKFPDAQYHKGITVTCPGFYGPQGRILRLPLAAPGLISKLTDFRHGNHKITNFEMETSAIYGLGKLLGHHCLSINVIVANRVVQQFSKDSNAAVEKMIKTSLEHLASPNPS
jgi:uridine phosphorylase